MFRYLNDEAESLFVKPGARNPPCFGGMVLICGPSIAGRAVSTVGAPGAFGLVVKARVPLLT
jgi:hypothetical protein